jgi:hypothetical protein
MVRSVCRSVRRSVREISLIRIATLLYSPYCLDSLQHRSNSSFHHPTEDKRLQTLNIQRQMSYYFVHCGHCTMWGTQFVQKRKALCYSAINIVYVNVDGQMFRQGF